MSLECGLRAKQRGKFSHNLLLSLLPVMLGHVEDDPVWVLELGFRIHSGKGRQLHEELPAFRFDLLMRRRAQ